MFNIHQIHNANSDQDLLTLSSVIRIYQKAFYYHPEYARKIAELLKFSNRHDFDIILLIAEGRHQRVLGFALSFYFPKLRFAYLDYLVSDPKRSRRGYGQALYEVTRETLLKAKCRGMFMDVPPDEKKFLKDTSRLKTNQRRMAFYERLGAFPIINTKYDQVSHKANQGYYTFLLYDNLGLQTVLSGSPLKKMIAKILQVKGNIEPGDTKLQTILKSVARGPVQYREPRYLEIPVSLPADLTLDIVTTGDAHQIHHLKEKGYVERPARIRSIQKGLNGFSINTHPVKNFSEKHITEVHSASLVRFLKKGSTELGPNSLLYPNVFPIRKPERLPKNWEMQAGYFCMDTFTPVTANVYKASRNAVNAALTGAHNVLKTGRCCYVMCRPPGHHAESRIFGGFCYFNNASIAANYLSKWGKVALLDIDYHHGNGSQEIFYKRNDVYFVSIHGHSRTAYPYFSGYRDECGEGAGKGFNTNYPLYPGVKDQDYLKILDDAITRIKRFKANYLVISLGLDIMGGDPTGSFLVTPNGMQQIGRHLRTLELPTLFVQEGGYSLRNLNLGIARFFKGYLEI